MLSEEQIEAKYKIVYVKKQRYYHENLSNKPTTLECTTPLSLEAGGESFIDTSWKQLLIDVCTCFISKTPFFREDLLRYTMPWNGKHPFSTIQDKNMYLIGDNIFLLCNQTALHACWLLRDILTIFGIDLSKCDLVIHRPPYAEPVECRQFYEKKTKDTFKYYYTQLLKYPEERADKVLRNIDRLNPLLARFSQAYDNFYLIDNNTTYASYKFKFLDYLRKELLIEEKMVNIADKYLSILGDFYKEIK